MGSVEQYDLSAKERRMVEDRAKIRSEFRKEFLKQWTNPHRHGDGGYLFDPALQRWQSMKSQQWYYFKPTPQTLLYPCIILGSTIAYAFLLHWDRTTKDKEYREGKVAYRDRRFKFV